MGPGDGRYQFRLSMTKLTKMILNYFKNNQILFRYNKPTI
jgi:hypothetical protein